MPKQVAEIAVETDAEELATQKYSESNVQSSFSGEKVCRLLYVDRPFLLKY